MIRVNPINTSLPVDKIVQTLLSLDNHIVEHAFAARRLKSFIADVYMAATMVDIDIIKLLTEEIPMCQRGQHILMVHDSGANDMDDFLLRTIFERMGATVIGFDVWRGVEGDEKIQEPYTLCITGPITPITDVFLNTIPSPAVVYWSLDSNFEGSNARTPTRIAFPVQEITSKIPDEDNKYPIIVNMDVPCLTRHWLDKFHGKNISAIPPRSERLFTVDFTTN